mgnify:CR=1 FL=1
MANKKNFGLDIAVRNVANGNFADYEFANDPQLKEQMVTICKGLVGLADGFNERDANGHFIKGGVGFTHTKGGVAKAFPMSFLVYFACGSDCHKESVFRKGYKKFDEKKAKEILRMLKFFGTYNGNNALSRNDKVVHAVTKYYKCVSPKMADFKRDVEQYWRPYPKTPKTMKEITIGLHVDAA